MQDISQYVAGLQEQFPDIKPYDMDDWDWTWSDEGYQFLEACDFGMAELTFQRLIAARPEDPDGYEGLAMVYKALSLRAPACMLIDEAFRLAGKQVQHDVLDRDALNEIRETQRGIHAMPEQKSGAAVEDRESDQD